MKVPNVLRLTPLLFLVVAVLAGGCGDTKRETGIVRGKVTYGDKKVAGVVRFVAEDGATGEGVIYTDGTYEVLQAPTGKCKVAIITEHLRAKQGMGPVAPVPGGPPGGGSRPPAGTDTRMAAPPKGVEVVVEGGKVPNGKYEPIPAKYEDPAKSNLTFEVQTGEQTYDITLK